MSRVSPHQPRLSGADDDVLRYEPRSPHLVEPRAPSMSLPRSLTSFIGRERVIDAVRALLAQDDVRLVTLTGPGGVGKTRLAVQAVDMPPSCFHDVWFVDLSSVDAPEQVAATIGQSLGIHNRSGRDVTDEVIDVLRGREELLILDNFEQVVEAAPFVVEMLTACPQLTILVTSRVPLRVSGERVFMVPPLALPDRRKTASLDHLLGSEGIRLFVDRATAISTDFALTPGNAAFVAEICERLDGVPLAIELAAARSNMLSPASMLKRMDEQVPILAGGPRNTPGRHRSMRDSILWSYDLLAPGERSLFRQLGMFAGTWTYEAAEAVAGGDGERGTPLVFDRLAALVDASLVRQEEGSGSESVYRMLVPVREFAAELLSQVDDVDEIHRRHARFITELLERAEVAPYLPDGPHCLERLRVHSANIPKVLAWMERQGEVDELLRPALTLIMFWNLEGGLHEGRTWLEHAVELGRKTRSPMLATGLIALGVAVHMQGDETLALEICAEAHDQLADDDDPFVRFCAHTLDGLIALRTLDTTSSITAQERALSVLRSVPDLSWARCAESTVLGHLGNIAVGQGDFDAAERWFEEALDIQRSLGYAPGSSHIMASHPIAGLGDVARARGDLPRAWTHYRDALARAHQVHDARAVAYALGGVAGTLAASGNWQVAARLFGADEAYHTLAGFHFELETMSRQRALGLPEPWLRATEAFGIGQPLRDALWSDRAVPLPPVTDTALAAELWEAGRSLSLEDAVAEALAAQLAAPAPLHADSLPFGLTSREVEVLQHLVRGQSDNDIAANLFISRRTVATHVEHIYNKIGVSSRAEAAAVAVRQGLA